MSNIYDQFSQVYDKFGVSDYAVRLGKCFLQYLAENYPGEHISSHLDICCGTGRLCGFMKQQGLDTCGYDISAEMIRQARRSFPEIPFSVADAAEYTDDKTYDLVTCTDDALNHLTEPAMLQAAFRTTAAVLRKGGFFFFDMNDIECQELYDDQPYEKGAAGEEKMIYQIARHSKHRLTVTLKYVRAGQMHWEGSVAERFYEESEVEEYLRQAGLTLIECRNEFYDATRPIKNIFIARK